MKTIVGTMTVMIAILSAPLFGLGLSAQQPDSADRGAQEAATQGLLPNAVGFRMAVESDHLGDTREILIRLPDAYFEEEERYPVLYVLDGDTHFDAFAGLVDYMVMFNLIPDMIVVGVPQGDRMRELTFTPANEAYGNWPTSGGGEVFCAFLTEELVPLIDRRFRTHPYRVLVGHSLGGLFAIESLGRRREAFQATLALSPSIAWNQYEWMKASETLFDDIPFWRQTLMISMEPRDDKADLWLARFQALVDARAPEGFQYHLARYSQESHTSVGVPGFYDNLRGVFSGWTLEAEWWQLGPEEVQAHFDGLSKRFGFAVSIPEVDLVGHAHHGLVAHEASGEAIQLLEFCLKLYPGSADARMGLGEVFEWKGEPDRAREWYQEALKVDPSHAAARRRLEGLGG